MSGMRPLIAAPLLICVFACACPKHVEALQCAEAWWQNFDRIDGDTDPEKRRQDAEARAALANLRPIVFRGRFAWARDLSDRRKNGSPVFLIVFRDVEVLRGEMPRSADDRKAFLVYYAWCDTRCGPASQWWPRGQTTFGVQPFSGGPVRDTNENDGTIGKKVVYKGRVMPRWTAATRFG